MENKKKVASLSDEQLGQVAGGAAYEPYGPQREETIKCSNCGCEITGTHEEILAHISTCGSSQWNDVNDRPGMR